MGSCRGAHVVAAAKAVGDEKDVGVAAWGKGRRTEVVDADEYAWLVW